MTEMEHMEHVENNIKKLRRIIVYNVNCKFKSIAEDLKQKNKYASFF